MLHEVLSKDTCAACRFCCAFRRKSLWEVPGMPLDFIEKYPRDVRGNEIQYLIQEKNRSQYVITDLRGNYKTEDPEEEAICPFLDPEKGCVLPEKDKPFDCKIWPLRYMEMQNGERKICLTPTCPAISKIPVLRMKKLVDDGLGEKIIKYAEQHPYMIKEYQNGFVVF